MKRNRPHSRITLALTSVGIMVAALLSGCTSDSPASSDSPGSTDSSGSAGNSDTSSALVVDTPDGAVQGVVVGEAEAFYGLPFAKPPVYDAMWTAPADPEPWEGTRDARKQAPACLQFEPTGVTNAQPTSLDCLYLDVYRPKDIAAGEKLPVMVFYHGGGNTQGSGVLYGGQTLAERERVILVSTNYRLGASGNFALAALNAEDPSTGGAFALLDQIKALDWVHRSIESFGGDPNNVTIFGQSAGAQAVCKLLVAPGSEGLFHKAIVQSIGCAMNLGIADQETAEAASETYAEALGCPAGDDQLNCLRYAWPAAMVTAFSDAKPMSIVGSGALPVAPSAGISEGSWHKVPVIVGSTRWESRLFRQADHAITAEQYEAEVRETYGDNAERVLATYPEANYESPFQALSALGTDTMMACAAEDNAVMFNGQGVPTYKYEFDDPTSPTLFGFQPEGVDMASAHSAELAYLFDFTLGDRPLTDDETKLAHTMQDYWAAFARDGVPTSEGAAEWPAYTADNPVTLSLGPTITTIDDFTTVHNCDLVAELAK